MNGGYWENAARLFLGSGAVDAAGSYFLHNKNRDRVRVGIGSQTCAALNPDGEVVIGPTWQSAVPVSSDDPSPIRALAAVLPSGSPWFFLMSPDIQRAFVDDALPLVFFTRPMLELEFSAETPDGRIQYAADDNQRRRGTRLLERDASMPVPDQPDPPPVPASAHELLDGWQPLESDESFLGRLTRAVALLDDHPEGKLTLARGYERVLTADRNPFDLYQLQARANGEYACSHFVCVGPGVYSLGASPENVFEVSHRHLRVDVVAATCRASAQEKFLARNLTADPKQLKEHGSSLISRQKRFSPYCVPGSVRVVQNSRVKTLRNVCHLHSVFDGELRPEVTVFDLVENIFPLLGARPAHLLDMADSDGAPHRYFAGLVGHLEPGAAEAFLNIRNLLLDHRTAHAKVGVGVLRESRPDSELLETKDKLLGLLEAVARWVP